MRAGRFAATVLILGALGCLAVAAGNGWAATAPPTKLTPGSDAFVQARYAAAAGNRERFKAAVAGAVAPPGLEPYLDYWRLQLALADEDTDSTLIDQQLRSFLKPRPTALVADLLRRDWLLRLGKRGEWATFEAEFPAWILRDDQRVFCLAGKARLLRGAAVGAEALGALEQMRDLDENCETLLVTLLNAGAFGPKELRQRLRLAIEQNSTVTIGIVAGLLGYDASDVNTALAKPERALARDPDSTLTMIALARLARSKPEIAAQQLEAASSTLTASERDFAWSQIAAAAMRRLDPGAREWTLRSLNAQASDETWEALTRAALRDQDWPLLLATTDRMSPANRREPAWVYWRGRALRALGLLTDSEAQFRSIADGFDFYGQLAAEELGELTKLPARSSPATPSEMALPAANPGFERALRFYELGLRSDGNKEWNYQLRGMSDRQLLAAATWACQQSVLDRCVNTASRTRYEHDFSLRFVTPFREQLASAAGERNLDPAWVYGLIRQESRFIMDASSGAGAKGLMQIMPATGRWIARKLGIAKFHPEQLNQLPLNLRFGTFYLGKVLEDLDGSPVLASAGYNAGPNRARSWRAALPGKVEGAIFAEIIPFNETRNYVKKVLSNTAYYAAAFTGQPQSLRKWLGSIQPAPAAPSELP